MPAFPDSKIFKPYDIRGLYPSELNEEAAYRIGKAIALFSNAKNAVVGRDVRLSSNAIFEALTRGLLEEGSNVTDIGICSTTQAYFASAILSNEITIMITASHNPKDYNGFKICRKNAVPVSGPSGIYEIRDLAQKNRFKPVPKKGTVVQFDLLDEYRKFFSRKTKKRFEAKVVVDAANSVGVFDAQILQKICTVIPLFFELDGNFPNHIGNPLDYATLKDLQQAVVKQKADLGIALDGDGDRISFVDEKGELVPNDIVTALLARFFPRETILFDVRSTRQIENEIKKVGGKPLRCRVGHTFIKQQMRETNAAFAGELSGHYYYRDLFFAESALQTALLVLRLLETEKKPLSELSQQMKKLFQSGEINFTVPNPQEKMVELEKRLCPEAKTISRLDGLTMEFQGWWFNLRPSNTEPLLRLNLEADSRELLEQKKLFLSQWLGSVLVNGR
jgi:phosphomannomutase